MSQLPPQPIGGNSSDFPAERAVAIVPDDDGFLPFITRGIYVGGVEGDIRVTTINGDDVVLPNVPTQYIFPIQVIRVWATGTVADQLVALA